MVKDLILVNREVLLTELYSVFDAHTAETLLHVLDNVAEQVHAAGVGREDFSELKQIVARIAEEIEKLAETQRQTEELINRRFEQHDQRLTNIEGDVNTLKSDVEILKEDVKVLKEDVKVLKEDVKVLKEDVKVLKEDVKVLKEDVKVLKEDVKVLKEDVKVLKEDVKGLKDDVGRLKGYMLESRYRDRAPSYFGRLLRRAKVIDLNSLEDVLETRLSSEEFEQLLPLDLLVTGKPKEQPQAEDIYLAVEISSIVDKRDVQRARNRAELLQKAGYKAVPVVAGEEMTEGAEPEACQQHVVILQDGRTLLWQEALTQWL